MKKDENTSKVTIWGYGAFGFGANCLGGILGSFLTLYLTDNLLLSSAFIAAMMLVGRISNACMEFLFGLIMDRTHSTKGKARPWIIWTSLGTALPVFMVFNTPAGLGDLGTKLWVIVSYMLHISVFGAAISIAYSTLLVKITSSPNTRVKMTNLSNLLGQVGGLVASSYGIPILMYFGGYQNGYKGMSFIFCTVGFIGMLLTGIICKEEPENVAAMMEEEKKKLEAKKNQLPLKESLGYVFKNKYAFPLLSMYVLYNFAAMLLGSVTVYYMRDVLGHAEYMTQISYAKIIPIILVGAVGLVPMASQKFGKKTALMAGAVALVVGFIVMAFSPTSLPVIMIGNIFLGIGTAFYGALMGASIADVADFVNRKNKVDVSATVSSVAYMGMRIGMALGSVGITVLLELGHYDAEAANAGLGQAASMITMEKVGYIYIPLVCYILLVLISKFMDVDKAILKLEAQK